MEQTTHDRRLGVADDLALVAEALSEGNETVAYEVARRVIAPAPCETVFYPLPPLVAPRGSAPSKEPSLEPAQKLKIYVRDGFVDRYAPERWRLVHPGALRVLSIRLGPSLFPTAMSKHNIPAQYATNSPVWFDVWPAVDHMQPRAAGGTNDPSNLITTGWWRNNAKGARSFEDTGWEVQPEGDLADWDGLWSWFDAEIARDPALLTDAMVATWHHAGGGRDLSRASGPKHGLPVPRKDTIESAEAPSTSPLSEQTELLRRLVEAGELGGRLPIDPDALADFTKAYRDAEEVRTRQRLVPTRIKAETLTSGRRIYPTVHEGGGTNHQAYLATNGRWRAVASGGGYSLWRMFGGSWTRAGNRWVQETEPVLRLHWGVYGTNVDAFEAALAQDRQDGLWPPPELQEQAALIRPRRPGVEPPAAPEPCSVRAVLLIDDDEEIYCVGHDDSEHDRCTPLDPSLPLAVALVDLTPGAEEVRWTAPTGPLEAAVVDIERSRDRPPRQQGR